MYWPVQRVEDVPWRDFRPPFCPNPHCEAHDGTNLRFIKHGRYRRSCDGRTIRQWRCKLCGRCCSSQTFSATYYLKRPELLPLIAAGLVAGSAHRQIARTFGCSHSTVGLQQARLGRHGLLFLLYCLKHIDHIEEPIVYDDFQSFVYSQDHAFGMATPVGQVSWFVYGLDFAPHRIGRRRNGRRRSVGREHRRRGAFSRSFRASVDRLLAKLSPGSVLELISDGHPAYRAGVAKHPARARIRHRVFPNPRCRKTQRREGQRRDAAMFAVDLLHKLLRHSQKHHGRETIAFGRRLNAALERGFVYVTWRNLIKGRSERKPDPSTPAMRLGLATEPWDWSRVLARRLFASHFSMPARWEAIYRRELITEKIGPNRRHILSYAF